MAKEREWWCLCQGIYPQRDFLRHLRNLGLQILLTSNGTYSPTTFRGLVTLCVPKRKNKKVNPGKILQKDLELVCSKTALFVVLLRCLTLGKLANWFRESKITRGYLEAIQTVVHLFNIPISLQRKESFQYKFSPGLGSVLSEGRMQNWVMQPEPDVLPCTQISALLLSHVILAFWFCLARRSYFLTKRSLLSAVVKIYSD